MDNYEALKNDIEKNINEMVNDLNLNVDSNNQMKNRFVEWMLKNQFEQKTVNNYTNAISVVSREAINENLINKPIYDIDNVKELDELLEKLNRNQTYIERRVASHNTNSAAMNQYRKFLEDINMTTIEEDNINIIEKFKKYYYLFKFQIDRLNLILLLLLYHKLILELLNILFAFLFPL